MLRKSVRTHCNNLEIDHCSSEHKVCSFLSVCSSVLHERTSLVQMKNGPNHLSFVIFDDWFFIQMHTYANINGKQSTGLHQRPYIPHFHVHADTLGEVFYYLWFSCRLVPQGNNCRVLRVPIFSLYQPRDLLIKTMGNVCFSPHALNSSLPLTMVHSIFCVYKCLFLCLCRHPCSLFCK